MRSIKVKAHKRKTKNGTITIKGFIRGFLGKIERHSPVVKKREALEEIKAEKVAAKLKQERLGKADSKRNHLVVMNSSNQEVSRHSTTKGVKLKPGQYVVDTSKKAANNNGRKWKRV